ncbi:MAG TPA: hypothetical protein VNS50_04470, partial [Ginsengibacter sp.]|nr:hypothetical protein [Ginsengibacter sp.]
MKLFLNIFLLSFVTNLALAQSFKFDFGTGTTANGYTKITPDSKFSYVVGFGFNEGSKVTAIKRKGNDILRCDYITSNKPFYFSVKIPEGNYDVKIILGDKNGTSATTVRAENRRLFLQNIRTKKGEIVEKIFTIQVRDSTIKDIVGNVIDKVKLKSREINYFHWDNLLTIEFNDSMPKVCGIEITPNKKAT